MRFPERRPAVRPLFPRAKPLHGPATARFRTFRAAPTSRWTSILQCAHRWIRDRTAALRAFLRGVSRVDDREPTTGPFSLVAQHRDHHARRSIEDLAVGPGLRPDVFAWTFDRALGGDARASQEGIAPSINRIPEDSLKPNERHLCLDLKRGNRPCRTWP